LNTQSLILKTMLFLLCVVFVNTGYAAIFYVTELGDDGNNRGYKGSPYRTVEKAVSVAECGDEILVSPEININDIKLTESEDEKLNCLKIQYEQ